MLASILTFMITVLIVFIVLKIFKVSLKLILKLIGNAIIGGLILFLFNLLPFVHMTINIWTALLTGIFGIPAVVVIFIISLF